MRSESLEQKATWETGVGTPELILARDDWISDQAPGDQLWRQPRDVVIFWMGHLMKTVVWVGKIQGDLRYLHSANRRRKLTTEMEATKGACSERRARGSVWECEVGHGTWISKHR